MKTKMGTRVAAAALCLMMGMALTSCNNAGLKDASITDAGLDQTQTLTNKTPVATPVQSASEDGEQQSVETQKYEQTQTLADPQTETTEEVAAGDTQPALEDGARVYDMTGGSAFLQNVRRLGRTYTAAYTMQSGDKETLDNVLYFNWSSSGFEIAFEGTGISVDLLNHRYGNKDDSGNTLDGTMYFYAFLDGSTDVNEAKLIKVANVERGTYVLAEGLEDGYHTVEVRRASRNVYGNFFDSRGLAGKAALASVKIEGSDPKLLHEPVARQRKLEFIGDSITCGDAIANYHGNANGNEDALRTYAAYTARNLNADWNVMSISGNGCIGSVLGGPLLDLPDQYLYTDAMGNGKVEWDFSQYQPDVVIVNLGTNDRACVDINKVVPDGEVATGKFTVEEFMNGVTRPFNAGDASTHHTGVKDFLNMIHENNPNAKIVWLCGAMGDELNPYIEQAINEWNEAEGETIAYFLGLPNDSTLSNGQGYDNSHPSEVAARVYAKALTEKIEEIMGW